MKAAKTRSLEKIKDHEGGFSVSKSITQSMGVQQQTHLIHSQIEELHVTIIVASQDAALFVVVRVSKRHRPAVPANICS
jgi:hypothetical protein